MKSHSNLAESGMPPEIPDNRIDLVSQSQQRAVFEALLGSSPVAVVYIDMQGSVITCNPAFETLFGYTLDEMKGRSVDDFVSNSGTNEEARSLTLQAGESKIVRKQTIRHHRNGSRVDVEILGMPVLVEGGAAGFLAQYHDVTHLKTAERTASNLYTSFRLLMDSIDSDVYVADLHTHEILFMNKHMEDSFGSGLVGKLCYVEFRELDAPCAHCTNRLLVSADGRPTSGVVWEDKNPITGKWYRNSDRAVFWTDNRLVRLQIATDISELKETELKLQYHATHDSLTGLPNRVLFHDRLDHALQTHKRSQSKFALMFLDLDHFKHINDTLGHLAGDQVLKEAAARMQGCIRASDTTARVSGDEFTFVIEHVDEHQDLDLVVARILKSISQPMLIGEDIVEVSCSIGISFFPEDGIDIDSLISHADFALYEAKSKGGNRACYYSQRNESS